MADEYYNIVRFTPDSGGDGAVIQLDGAWKITAGVKPDINTATCAYTEYDSVKDSLGQTGTVDFCFSDPNSGDVSITSITLLDAEPLEYGIPAGEDAVRAVKYRLTFCDDRYGFVSPRGGRLYLGLINPSTIDAPDPDRTQTTAPMTMTDCIQACLDAMGIDADIPDDADDVDAPQDLKWFGTHAPTELEKLLAMANCVLVLQSDASYEIHALGDGSDPEIPDDFQLPTTTLTGVDARGKTVVFSSYPTQIANVLTSDDLPDDAFDIVYINKDGAWQKIDDCGEFGGNALTEMQGHFANTPDPKSQWGCYRYLRLDGDLFDPIIQPLLRKCWAEPNTGDDDDDDDDGDEDDTTDSDNPNGLPPQIELDFRALIATQDPTTGLWSMPGDKVKVPLIAIYRGNVLCFGMRLVKLKSTVTSTSDLEGNCDTIDFANDIEVRFAVGDAEWDAEKSLFKPHYFYCGYSGTADSPTLLDSDDAESALTDEDTIVVPIAELQAVLLNESNDDGSTDTDPYNLQKLQDKCQKLVARYLKDSSTPAKIMAGAGFIDYTFDGNLTEVTIDQERIITQFKVNAWFRPTGSYLASEWRRLREPHESHPHEAKTQGQRTANGASGSNEPVSQVGHYTPLSNGLAKPTQKYQVYTPIDDTLNPIWTSARFM